MNAEAEKPMPLRRFPEFQEQDGWVDHPFSELYDFKPTNSLSREKLNYENGEIRNIHYGDIHTRFSVLFDITKEIVPFINPVETDRQFASECYCQEGDMVFADASEDVADVGKSIEIVALHGEPVVSGTHTILARRRGAEPIVGFGGYLFRSSRIRTRIQAESQGAKVLGISPTRLSRIRVAIPPTRAEQQKIADCLSSLDELIAAQGRKVEVLKAHKKGLMQQLLPRLNEGQPRLRFFGYEGSKWRTEKLSAILRKVAKQVAIEPEATYREIGIRSHGKGIFHKDGVTGREIGKKRVFHIVKNALILSIVFAWERAVATTSIVEEGMIASHRFPMYVAKSSRCDVRYVKEFFLTQKGKHLLGVASPGGAGRNKTLGQRDFEELEINLPSSLKEQAAIADCLAAADALIVEEGKKLASLHSHKKGLMHQLFPSAVAIEA